MERIILKNRIWVYILFSTNHLLLVLLSVLIYFMLRDFFALSQNEAPELFALIITLIFSLLLGCLLKKLARLKAENDQFVRELRILKDRVHKAQVAYYQLNSN